MMANLKYEFIKLFTVRSTYVLTLLTLALSMLIMIVTVAKTPNLHELVTADAFKQLFLDAPLISTLVGAVVAILIVGQEYRYNTIAYTLTASRSRAEILIAKTLVTLFFSISLALAAIVLVLTCFYTGLSIRDSSLALPGFSADVAGTLLRSLLHCGGIALFALLLASLVRNITFAIVAFFMIPTIEQLLGIVLKNNIVYLPATALEQVNAAVTADPLATPLKGGLIFLVYLVVGSAISYLLFVRRDAN